MTPLSSFASGCYDITFAPNLATLNDPITFIFSIFYKEELEGTPLELIVFAGMKTPAQ